MLEYHKIQPIYDDDSTILILGSFPSVKSREANFFYHHPQNRFWKILANLFNQDVPVSIVDKKQFLFKYHIALWDVIKSCEINGSSDSSITNVTVNDLQKIITNTKIKHIYTNGNLADKLYHQYFDNIINLPVTKLPSSSPANARYSLEELIAVWRIMVQ